jgi:hypothetical protein
MFTVSHDKSTIRYIMIVKGIEHITDAHLHLGAPGQNAPAVASLLPHAHHEAKTRSDVQVIRGTLTAEDLFGSLAGATSLDRLLAAMQTGNIYANIHTHAYPRGEIRGQITPFHESTGMRSADAFFTLGAN